MQHEFQEHRHIQLLTDKQVAGLLGISKSGVWAKAKQDSGFPQPFKLSENQTRWKLSAVEAFIDLKASSTMH
ncbi:helix-turn-helix transcriptional regulator [Rugamonas aquatica]|uniref:AlpA family phage regulatory protein n=1 Tax=Rugamonas aquatica TaxID=2743357 RepID=A0A6A7MYL8_9BURK|nr:AlpA family phage regulatory protein [Rugamonas aquatica]MQA37839.1 AlpA family phage regulatory protein [Rugamonas aquatica]